MSGYSQFENAVLSAYSAKNACMIENSRFYSQFFLSFLFVPHEFAGSEDPISNVGDISVFRSSSGKTGSTTGEFVELLLILSLRGNGKVTAGLIPGLFRRHYDHGRGSERHSGMENILTSCLGQVESGRQQDLQSHRVWNYWIALLDGPDALIDWSIDWLIDRLTASYLDWLKWPIFHLFHMMSCLLCWK